MLLASRAILALCSLVYHHLVVITTIAWDTVLLYRYVRAYKQLLKRN